MFKKFQYPIIGALSTVAIGAYINKSYYHANYNEVIVKWNKNFENIKIAHSLFNFEPFENAVVKRINVSDSYYNSTLVRTKDNVDIYIRYKIKLESIDEKYIKDMFLDDGSYNENTQISNILKEEFNKFTIEEIYCKEKINEKIKKLNLDNFELVSVAKTYMTYDDTPGFVYSIQNYIEHINF